MTNIIDKLAHGEMPTIEEIVALHNEAKRWKEAAIYLADCHAATAEGEGILKSTSKYSRRRYLSICKTAAELLDGGRMNKPCGSQEWVRDRCLSAVEALSKQ